MEITLPPVRTDLTEWDCYSILFSMGALKGCPIQTQRLPFPGLWEYATVDKRSVITPDLEENRKAFFGSVA